MKCEIQKTSGKVVRHEPCAEWSLLFGLKFRPDLIDSWRLTVLHFALYVGQSLCIGTGNPFVYQGKSKSRKWVTDISWLHLKMNATSLSKVKPVLEKKEIMQRENLVEYFPSNWLRCTNRMSPIYSTYLRTILWKRNNAQNNNSSHNAADCSVNTSSSSLRNIIMHHHFSPFRRDAKLLIPLCFCTVAGSNNREL